MCCVFSPKNSLEFKRQQPTQHAKFPPVILLVCQASVFDAIVTVFFLDTAPVVMEYIEAIAR